MLVSRTFRHTVIVLSAVALSACATVHDPFDAPAAMAAKRAPEQPSTFCPVVLSNRTDQQLDAGYLVGGVDSVLGLIPAGRSLSFQVSCAGGEVVAYAVASTGGFLGGGNEYRAVAPLDTSRETRLDFTLANRVR